MMKVLYFASKISYNYYVYLGNFIVFYKSSERVFFL